ncbi:hypothetical protein PLEI_0230 [Photobacterium leiognathi lrivu.4.1]|uniref:Uncharacterized protein n=1 Tax=Photobacterium leiognathi lrivu.4.1 TaxID=1248232 RepID=V5EMM7_PHOLE|nr:hypothetical protein [Photobacterium leiognathi]GAD28589.1 hypothetical protein PLEI_0230 [Photobacterium leiognathi lrivu.4.1]
MNYEIKKQLDVLVKLCAQQGVNITGVIESKDMVTRFGNNSISENTQIELLLELSKEKPLSADENLYTYSNPQVLKTYH